MKPFISVLLPILCLLLFSNASSDYHVLVPMSDHGWPGPEHRQEKRGANDAMTLQQMEHFVWGSDSGGGVFANMTLGTNDEELVISMERFAGQLKAVDCSENMMLAFKSNSTYQDAIEKWDWVNFNDNRTFIIIANALGCDPHKSRQPWVVRNVRYDDENFTVFLNASMKTWAEIGQTNTFSLDFGKYSLPASNLNQKRFGVDLPGWVPDKIDLPGPVDIPIPDKISVPDSIGTTQSFSIPLARTIPGQFFKQSSKGNFNFGIECVNCGVSGTLELQGHIESGVNGLTEFTITAIPRSVIADLTLQLSATGTLGKGWQKQFNLFRFGIPALTIPKILTVGPNIQLDAGFDISQISGSAVVTTGVVATIPDSSVASVDFKNKKKLTTKGWVPTFKTKPVTVDAQVDAHLEAFFQMNIAVSLECLDNGFNLDLGLKMPEININAEAKYNSAREVCPNSNKHAGLSILSSAGAELVFQAYGEVGGHKEYIVNESLFSKPNFFNFPSICLPFGGKPSLTTLSTKVAVKPTRAGVESSSTASRKPSASSKAAKAVPEVSPDAEATASAGKEPNRVN